VTDKKRCPNCGGYKTEYRGPSYYASVGFFGICIGMFLSLFIPILGIVGIPLIVAGAVMILGSPLAKKKYVCKNCGYEWQDHLREEKFEGVGRESIRVQNQRTWVVSYKIEFEFDTQGNEDPRQVGLELLREELDDILSSGEPLTENGDFELRELKENE